MVVGKENGAGDNVVCPIFVLRQAVATVIDRIESAIHENWERACEEAALSPVDKNYFWVRQVLAPVFINR